LCGACHAPMACQEDSCWHCGVQWATEDVPRPSLRAITGERLARPAQAASLEAERWMNDGGSVGSEAPAPLRAVAAGA
jgi:hypothetical protein